MADTDDTQPVDMNALLRDRSGTAAAWAARLFGIADTQPDDETTEPDDGGDPAA